MKPAKKLPKKPVKKPTKKPVRLKAGKTPPLLDARPEWRVEKEGLICHKQKVAVLYGCWHRRGKPGACGGCYARMAEALRQIAIGGADPAVIYAEVTTAARAEKRPL
jgi:hypothetical protein